MHVHQKETLPCCRSAPTPPPPNSLGMTDPSQPWQLLPTAPLLAEGAGQVASVSWCGEGSWASRGWEIRARDKGGPIFILQSNYQHLAILNLLECADAIGSFPEPGQGSVQRGEPPSPLLSNVLEGPLLEGSGSCSCQPGSRSMPLSIHGPPHESDFPSRQARLGLVASGTGAPLPP